MPDEFQSLPSAGTAVITHEKYKGTSIPPQWRGPTSGHLAEAVQRGFAVSVSLKSAETVPGEATHLDVSPGDMGPQESRTPNRQEQSTSFRQVAIGLRRRD